MTAIPTPSGSAPQDQVGAFGGRAPILLAFPERAPQQRLTVLVRIILAIPHLIALAVLGFVAEIVVVIGWFGALFTGRLPRFADDYLSGWLHWHARVSAYCLLLTGAYPPFALGDADYPVRLAVPPPGPLNRLAVFFRIILAIPAAIVVSCLFYGAQTIMLFVTWLIVLVTGIMPASLYEAYAAVMRYYIRYIGYLTLLTGEYPDALFGDLPARGEFATDAAGFPGQPGAFPVQPGAFPAQPSSEPGGFATEPTSFSAEPTGFPATVGQPPLAMPFGATSAGQPWQLVLSQGARRLIILFIAIGVVLFVGNSILSSLEIGKVANTVATRTNAIDQVQAAYSTLSNTLSSFQAKSAACQGNVSCVTALDRQASQAFDTFGTSVQDTAMPDRATTSAADQLAAASSQAGQLLLRLGQATSAAQYEAILTSTNVQQILDQVDVDYQNLGTKLNAS